MYEDVNASMSAFSLLLSHYAGRADNQHVSGVKRDGAGKRMMYFANSNAQFFNETDLRKAIDKYDVSMSIKPAVERKKRWDLWGGLYYAGTIYTTIGYGDLAAVTFWGRVFTMVYAIFGIPMVITILNDWGTIMFKTANSEFKFNSPYTTNCIEYHQ
ncbi:Ion channel [Teladorsagia circumcincta]|uniref:Ion channel n=1 Tax=Teladorsagia circumcincta TaxID=45464 RepID=A0A2G9U4F4_TELCI|nr:Ion channel [Teladorsagia circumcincta]